MARAATKKWRDAAVESEAERLALAESSKIKNEEIGVLRVIARDLDNRLEEEIERFEEAIKAKNNTTTAWFAGADVETDDEGGKPRRRELPYVTRRLIVELLCAGVHPSSIGTVMAITGARGMVVPSNRFMRRMRNEMRIVVETLAALVVLATGFSRHWLFSPGTLASVPAGGLEVLSFDGTAKDGADYITCNAVLCRRSTGEKRTLCLRGGFLTDGKSAAPETASLREGGCG